MKHRERINDVSATHKWAHGPSGWSVAARVLIIMIASLLILSLRASITRADDSLDDPADVFIYIPMVAHLADPPPPGPGWTSTEKVMIKKIVDEAAKLPPLAEEDHTIEELTLEPPGDEYKYTYEKHDVVDNIDNIYHLGLNDDLIWPGNLIRGDTAHDFVYNPIVLPRAPLILSVSLEGSPTTGPSITQEVVDPKLSTVRQGISDLLKKAIKPDTTVPARAEFKYQQVYSESHMNLFAEANVEYGAVDLKSRFDWNSITKKNKIMARYRQVYYTIDMDTPASHASLFDPSRTSVAEIGTAIPAGSMPMYVATVKYGMMALMFIETDYSEKDMSLALDAVYGGGGLETEIKTGLKVKDVMAQTDIQIVVYGGSTAHLKDLETGYAGFKKVIEASSDFTQDTPGIPLVYVFRHLKDNILGEITLTSQYTLVRPLQVRQRVKITAEEFKITDCDDEGSDNTVEIDRVSVWVKGFNAKSEIDPGELVNDKAYPTYEEPYGTVLVAREAASWWSMYTGDTIALDERVDLTFDTDTYDFNFARMEFTAYARDSDTNDAVSEEAWQAKIVYGDEFFGEQIISLISDGVEGPDFKADIKLKIEKVSSPSPPPSPFAGTPVSYEAYNDNLPNFYLYERDFDITLVENDDTPAFAKYATFKKKPGLTDPDDDELTSFESIAVPGYYLRHTNFELKLEEYKRTTSFANDATFRMVPGLADRDLYSFASVNYPNYYLHHSNYVIKLQQYDHTTQFAADATFREVPGLAE